MVENPQELQASAPGDERSLDDGGEPDTVVTWDECQWERILMPDLRPPLSAISGPPTARIRDPEAAVHL